LDQSGAALAEEKQGQAIGQRRCKKQPKANLGDAAGGSPAPGKTYPQ